MNDLIQTIVSLDRGQVAQLTMENGEQIVGRANQFDFDSDDSLRLEFSSDESGDYSRYQLLAHVDRGEWSPVQVRQFDPALDDEDWSKLGPISEVQPLAEHLMLDSVIDTGYEG